MPITQSAMPELGLKAPDFRLTDVRTGAGVSLEAFAGKDALLVMFIACHCPFSAFVRDQLASIAESYTGRPVGIVAICSSDTVQHPMDGPEGLRQFAEQTGRRFPVCADSAQQAAKAFNAACTPDFFLFDRNRNLAYRGRLDESKPSNPPPVLTGRDLRNAIDAVLEGRPCSREQFPSMGCNIKWKPGNEPEYALTRTAAEAK